MREGRSTLSSCGVGEELSTESGGAVAQRYNAGLSIERTPSRIPYTLAPLMATRCGVVTSRQNTIIVLVLCNIP